MLTMNNLLKLQSISNADARIFVFEGPKFGFEINRIYFTRDVVVGAIRGHHAHKSLRQVIVCPHGAIRVCLDDGLGHRESVDLDSPEKGLYVGPALWRTMEWLLPESLLLVFASEVYRESDYIRDYEEFRRFASSLPRSGNEKDVSE